MGLKIVCALVLVGMAAPVASVVVAAENVLPYTVPKSGTQVDLPFPPGYCNLGAGTPERAYFLEHLAARSDLALSAWPCP